MYIFFTIERRWLGKRSKKIWDTRAKGLQTQDWRATGRVNDWGELSVLPRALVRERSGTLRELVLWVVGYGPNSFLAELPNTRVSKLFYGKGPKVRGPHVKKMCYTEAPKLLCDFYIICTVYSNNITWRAYVAVVTAWLLRGFPRSGQASYRFQNF
jgi:hypothetical protein